jgi:hypothetical protein
MMIVSSFTSFSVSDSTHMTFVMRISSTRLLSTISRENFQSFFLEELMTICHSISVIKIIAKYYPPKLKKSMTLIKKFIENYMYDFKLLISI